MGRILYPLAGAILGYVLTVLVVFFAFKWIIGGKGLELLGVALMTYLAIGPAGAMGGLILGYRLWARRHTDALIRDLDGDRDGDRDGD